VEVNLKIRLREDWERSGSARLSVRLAGMAANDEAFLAREEAGIRGSVSGIKSLLRNRTASQGGLSRFSLVARRLTLVYIRSLCVPLWSSFHDAA